MAGEFNLITQYFVNRQTQRKDVQLSLGDDSALVTSPDNVQIAISTDTLVAGTHFLENANPAWVAHKALASNLSDLAAMGASPAWVSLALTLPEPDELWLAPFTESFFELANYFNIQLIGGDTTKGPLSMTLTVQGFVPEGQALRRDGAKVGDWLYVTGTLGDAAAGLEVVLDDSKRNKEHAETLEYRHYHASPRLLAGQALRNVASSCLDISDGLVSDLGHIMKASTVGAVIDVDAMPISDELLEYCGDRDSALRMALSSGEEYELCFTVPEEHKGQMDTLLAPTGTKATCVGQIRSGDQLQLERNGKALDWQLSGYDHFKGI
ncbi:thiamine-phosphate kinase [Vibrio tapetis subsp. quintayensis]|uniref:thiamine-phosphate kinase n=1 Tax=Vibrio tapetis TaxID=52443 RepID=UPI0025B4A1B1|nr:thiamine-phosphate kinase [Vibrio tapetis]MDN3680041.1 thiamine-phosphate kinase [Vibrio tapetis subsp. quintayensis]